MSQKKQQENEKEQSLEEAFQELEEMIEKNAAAGSVFGRDFCAV